MKRILILIVSVLITNLILSQTPIEYDLDLATIHVSPVPNPIGVLHPATDYSGVTKPLVVEPFPTNSQVGVNAVDVLPGAGNIPNVFYGGDLPGGLGAIAVPIYTKEVYSEDDFPLLLECDFYSRLDIPPYNEHYFIIVPADYIYFSSPTYNVSGVSITKEGIVIGGRPYESWVQNNFSVDEPSVMLTSEVHNSASNGEWYNARCVLDLSGGELVVQELSINSDCIFDDPVVLGSLDWLSNFRLGIAVDDLAHNFKTTTEYSSLQVDFALPESVCLSECIELENLSITSSCDGGGLFYEWSMMGMTFEPNDLNEICFEAAGTYEITLKVQNQNESKTLTKTITIVDMEPCDPEDNEMPVDTTMEMSQDSVLFNTRDLCFIIPNAFSPNGDGVNDLFRFILLDENCLSDQLGSLTTRIYNRWGELIHQDSTIESGWDGRYRSEDCDLGVYIYVLEYEVDGETVLQSGDVALIR